MTFLHALGLWFLHNWGGSSGYLRRTLEHIEISGAVMAAAGLIAIPLGAWFGHRKRGGLLAVSAVNVGRALPSFGIIALALPFTMWLAGKVPFIHSGLGFFPTFVALFALALPPIFTNTYTGVRGADPEVVEAARGMGLGEGRILRDVELPLAVPLVLAGLRISAVQVVATATLGALVAYGGLGRFIIDGFAVQDSVQIVAGATLVALLAVLTELGFGFLQRRLVPRGIRIRSAAATAARGGFRLRGSAG